MNKEEAKRYLFERVPDLVRCDPKAKWATLFNNEGDGLVLMGYGSDLKETALASMEIPRDKEGNLDLKISYNRGGQVMNFHGMIDGKYVTILGDGSIQTYAPSLFEPIYPGEEKEAEENKDCERCLELEEMLKKTQITCSENGSELIEAREELHNIRMKEINGPEPKAPDKYDEIASLLREWKDGDELEIFAHDKWMIASAKRPEDVISYHLRSGCKYRIKPREDDNA